MQQPNSTIKSTSGPLTSFDVRVGLKQHSRSSAGPAFHAEAGLRPPSINANGLISSQRLHLLLKYVTDHPFISHERLAVEGLEVAVEEARMIMILNLNASQKKRLHQHGQSKQGTHNKDDDAGSRVGLNVSPISAKAGSIVSGSTTAVQLKTQDVAVTRKVAASEKIKEMQTELRIAREQKMAEFISEDAMDEMEEDERQQTVQPGAVTQEPSAIQGLLKDSVVGAVRIGSSVSTKLDYILSEVCHVFIHGSPPYTELTLTPSIREDLEILTYREIPHILKITTHAELRCRRPRPCPRQIPHVYHEGSDARTTAEFDDF